VDAETRQLYREVEQVPVPQAGQGVLLHKLQIPFEVQAKLWNGGKRDPELCRRAHRLPQRPMIGELLRDTLASARSHRCYKKRLCLLQCLVIHRATDYRRSPLGGGCGTRRISRD